MEIVEHLSEIGYILFHVRKDEGQHLYAVNGKLEVFEKADVDESIYRNVSTAELYVVVPFERIDLDCCAIHSHLKKPIKKETRYDAQFEFLYNLK